MKLLFIRLDRIGDLILTLPVDESLPDTDVRWWVTQGLGFIPRSASPARAATEVPRKIDFRRFLSLWRDLRRERFDGAVVFHGPWWVSALLWLARVPLRAGVRSQWHSFLFLNRTLRQKRSRAECSELEYNFRLLEGVLGKAAGSLQRSSLRLTTTSEPGHGLKVQAYTVVHPGMAGSARNWPSQHYIELIRELSRTRTIVITGTPSDEEYLAPVRAGLQGVANIVWLDGRLKTQELIAVLANAREIVAPSTGVLHLAASTGRPTLGLFSPVRVQQPRRWGPQGPRVATLMPEVECPGEMACLGTTCAKFDCMTRITVPQALEALKTL